MQPLLNWLAQGASDSLGPDVVAVPVNWAADALASSARRWFRRLRRTDDLSRLVKAAAGSLVELDGNEFARVRRLLEEEQTWRLLGHGTVAELAALLAASLPERSGLSSQESYAAVLAIARGLLEFAVADLEPKTFQRVLIARLQRLEAAQATALDNTLLAMHADLAAGLEARGGLDRRHLDSLMRHLSRVLDRLPPSRAERGEVTLYLAALVRWLNTDPWPQDTRFGAPALSPGDIERKLRVTSGDAPRQNLDADELGRQCVRLVVLGGPGSGKTWLARRTARRCAETALKALAAGAGVDEVELPLYTTCARLSASSAGEGIRSTLVSAALGYLPDLGGARILDALRLLFEERNAPTLLVADSLDEAPGTAYDRIRQADTMPAPWRIMITSRPGSWDGGLATADTGPDRLVGTLQPLRYPDDVEAFAAAWFSGRPARAARLVAQLRKSTALRQAATVPLILAFYCIIGTDQPLPSRRTEVYGKVIRRMLTGRWRGSGDQDPDPAACLETLRDWAWSARGGSPVSGVGAWADEFPTPRVTSGPDDRDALGHAAAPLGKPDPETGTTLRRFAHRSLQEHMVAERVAMRMSAGDAAAELVNHLWFDPDWEYAAPAALAMHPERDEVLRQLISLVTGNGQLPESLRQADSCWEVRRFLARAAQESCEADWSPRSAQIIRQAMVDLAAAQPASLELLASSDWPSSADLIMGELVGRLRDGRDVWRDRDLPGTIAGLAATPRQRMRARKALGRVLVSTVGAVVALELANAISQLSPTVPDRAHGREALLGVLAHEPHPLMAGEVASAFARLAVTAQERALAREALVGLLAREHRPYPSRELTDAIARLKPTQQDRARLRQALLGMLKAHESTRKDVAEAIVRLGATALERAEARQVLIAEGLYEADELAGVVAELAETPPERAEARQALLGMLESDSGWRMTRMLPGLTVTARERAEVRQGVLRVLAAGIRLGIDGKLAGVVAEFAVTARERAEARNALVGILDAAPRRTQELAGSLIKLAVTAGDRTRTRRALLSLLETSCEGREALAETVAQLDPTVRDQARARRALLGLLSEDPVRGSAWWAAEALVQLGPTAPERKRFRQALLTDIATRSDPWVAGKLTGLLLQLRPTARDRAAARRALLALLARPHHNDSPRSIAHLAELVSQLDPTAKDRARARHDVLSLLEATVTSRDGRSLDCQSLAEVISRLDPTASDRSRALRALITLLARQPWNDEELASDISRLAVTVQERGQARQSLLSPIADQRRADFAGRLAGVMARLAVTARERAEARHALFRLVKGERDWLKAGELAGVIAGLAITAREQAELRPALLGLITEQGKPMIAAGLARAVAQLAPNPHEQDQSRSALRSMLAAQGNEDTVDELQEVITKLSPTVADLIGWHSSYYPPRAALLAAARRNTSITAWLHALPLFSRSRAERDQSLVSRLR
jgi:hypothetical protein